MPLPSVVPREPIMPRHTSSRISRWAAERVVHLHRWVGQQVVKLAALTTRRPPAAPRKPDYFMIGAWLLFMSLFLAGCGGLYESFANAPAEGRIGFAPNTLTPGAAFQVPAVSPVPLTGLTNACTNPDWSLEWAGQIIAGLLTTITYFLLDNAYRLLAGAINIMPRPLFVNAVQIVVVWAIPLTNALIVLGVVWASIKVGLGEILQFNPAGLQRVFPRAIILLLLLNLRVDVQVASGPGGVPTGFSNIPFILTVLDTPVVIADHFFSWAIANAGPSVYNLTRFTGIFQNPGCELLSAVLFFPFGLGIAVCYFFLACAVTYRMAVIYIQAFFFVPMCGLLVFEEVEHLAVNYFYSFGQFCFSHLPLGAALILLGAFSAAPSADIVTNMILMMFICVDLLACLGLMQKLLQGASGRIVSNFARSPGLRGAQAYAGFLGGAVVKGSTMRVERTTTKTDSDNSAARGGGRSGGNWTPSSYQPAPRSQAASPPPSYPAEAPTMRVAQPAPVVVQQPAPPAVTSYNPDSYMPRRIPGYRPPPEVSGRIPTDEHTANRNQP